jgi:hypothetical protein
MTFEEAMRIGRAIMEHGAGHPVKRTTLLKKLSLTDGDATRALITASGKYGITGGSYASEMLELTDKGRLSVDESADVRNRMQSRFELAIQGIHPFSAMYERFKGGKLPAPEVMRDSLGDIDQGDRAQCVDIFISNAQSVGILQTKDGAQHLLSIEQYIASPATVDDGETRRDTDVPGANGGEIVAATKEDFSKVCFFIAPIGDEGSEHRQHSDAILSSFVEPAMAEHGMRVVRADKISKPGMISQQVIEYLVKSKLVVADLSYHNPNVFYELSLRHATGKPTVHVIRDADKIPFDLANFRTIPISMGSVFTVLAKLETYRAEIAQQIRQVLADGVTTNNPILAYCPDGRFTINGD